MTKSIIQPMALDSKLQSNIPMNLDANFTMSTKSQLVFLSIPKDLTVAVD